MNDTQWLDEILDNIYGTQPSIPKGVPATQYQYAVDNREYWLSQRHNSKQAIQDYISKNYILKSGMTTMYSDDKKIWFSEKQAKYIDKNYYTKEQILELLPEPEEEEDDRENDNIYSIGWNECIDNIRTKLEKL